MKIRKSLSAQIAAAVAVATLFGPSAFAESRHHQATARGHASGGSGRSSQSSGRGESRLSRGSQQRDRASSSSRYQQSDRSSSTRNDQRGREWRDTSRQDRRSVDSRNQSRSSSRDNRNGYRDNSQSYRGRDNSSYPRQYRGGERFNGNGHIRNILRENNGYRVWLDGGRFPFFIPFSRWALHPLRIGLSVRFGGYYDPLGYVSVYDIGWPGGGYGYDGYRDGYGYGNREGYGYGPVATSGQLRGIVESINYRGGTLFVRDDTSREVVTVTMPRDRRMEEVREGDYVEFSGTWGRGVFEADRLDVDRYDADRSRDDGSRY
jgi:hypothetical protein